MKKRNPMRIGAIAVISLLWSMILAAPLHAEDNIEKAGVVVGVTAGNLWFVPLKAISVSMGALSGAMSFVLSGGNVELTKQIWRDTLPGPYVLTPEMAKKAIGERPELLRE
ncbi:MAG: hypothetical protein OEN50_10120 [Deltaproteobacteria bacterium]|nr:hypothetical protein [Deltaproteobacteria bacterium]